MLKETDVVLMLVDVQGKLAQIIHDSEQLHKKTVQLIKGLQTLNIPIIWMEQNPQGLGPTSPEISELLTTEAPISKMTFNALETEAVIKELQQTERKQVLLAGIESHICIYQTAKALTSLSYNVQVVADAVSSRTKDNHELALSRLQKENISLTSVEMALFEMLRTAEHPKFKEVLKAIK
ncbi:hydrolase [Ornithinibacillus sp. 4-3]|uniref:Hydrolase n=1 Tax=Ornithinibacillus sp. 4-3 TaxID=3231488 RepID=A0AB39HJ90_9BACI